MAEAYCTPAEAVSFFRLLPPGRLQEEFERATAQAMTQVDRPLSVSQGGRTITFGSAQEAVLTLRALVGLEKDLRSLPAAPFELSSWVR